MDTLIRLSRRRMLTYRSLKHVSPKMNSMMCSGDSVNCYRSVQVSKTCVFQMNSMMWSWFRMWSVHCYRSVLDSLALSLDLTFLQISLVCLLPKWYSGFRLFLSIPKNFIKYRKMCLQTWVTVIVQSVVAFSLNELNMKQFLTYN